MYMFVSHLHVIQGTLIIKFAEMHIFYVIILDWT